MQQSKYEYVTLKLTLASYSDIPEINRLMALIIYLLEEQINTFTERYQNSSGSEFVPHRYTQIHAQKTLKKFLGKHYRRIVEQATSMGLVKILCHNKSGTESFAHFEELSYCKQYTVNDIIWDQLVHKEFIHVPVKVPNPAIRASYSKKRLQSVTPDKFLSTKANIDQLRMHSDLYKDPEYYYFDSYQQIYAFNSMNHNISDGNPDDLSEEKIGRIYHSLICMKRKLRRFVFHISGKRIAVIDVSAMNPTLLAFFIPDPAERQIWLDLCNSGNFYTELVGVSKEEKEEWKPHFMKAMSSKKLKRNKKAQAIREIIKQKFPGLHRAICEIHASGITVSKKLGMMETSIIRTPFADENRFHLSMHDGLAVLEEDLVHFETVIHERAMSVLGYKLSLRRETLGGDIL